MRPWLLRTRRVMRMPGRNVTGEVEPEPPGPPPVLTSIAPTSGPPEGGTACTLTGTDFVDGCTVTFGGVEATSVVFVDSTEVTCVSPAGAEGVVNVTLTNPDDQSDTLVGEFEYIGAFDPADLTLTGWWRGPFSASPWSGVASAGTSGSNAFSEATNPPSVGSTLNGIAPPDFDGSNDNMSTSAQLSAFISSSATASCSGWVLFNADAATADAGAGSRHNNPQFFSDANQVLNIGFSSAGVHVSIYDTGAAYTERVIACGTGGWHLLCWRITHGSLVEASLDGGAFQTTSFAGKTISSFRSVIMRCGAKGTGLSPFFNGRIMEQAVAASALSDGDFDNVVAYINDRYGLAF